MKGFFTSKSNAPQQTSAQLNKEPEEESSRKPQEEHEQPQRDETNKQLKQEPTVTEVCVYDKHVSQNIYIV